MIPLTQQTLSCGVLISGTILTTGEQDEYTFTGSVGNIISLTLVQTAGFPGGHVVRTTLLTAAGDQVSSFVANSQPEITLPVTGVYTVQIYSNSLVGTGTYHIGLECLAPLGPIDKVLSAGDLVISTIEAAGEQDLYTFNGSAGDIVSIALTQTAGFPGGNVVRATLFTAAGDQVSSFTANAQPEIPLPATGTYILQINSSSLIGTGTYQLGLD